MGTNSMYKFPRVSEYRHFFYHTSQKSSRIKKWSIFLHFHCTGVIGDAGKTKRELILGTDGQTYRDFIFWRGQQQEQNVQFFLGSPVSLCTAVYSWIRAVPWECLARRDLQPSPLSLTCPMAPLPLNTLQQQQQGVNVCVHSNKRTSLAITEVPAVFFPSHASTGGHYPPLDLSTKHQFACKKHHRNSTGGQVLSKPISQMFTLIFGLF